LQGGGLPHRLATHNAAGQSPTGGGRRQSLTDKGRLTHPIPACNKLYPVQAWPSHLADTWVCGSSHTHDLTHPIRIKPAAQHIITGVAHHIISGVAGIIDVLRKVLHVHVVPTLNMTVDLRFTLQHQQWSFPSCAPVPHLLGVLSRHPTPKHAVLWAVSRFTMSAGSTTHRRTCTAGLPKRLCL
jgi:hypothetical protein